MGQIIAIVPGSGGVGASVLAAAVAVRAAAAHRSVVAVDLDPWSGGLDTVFGLEQEPGWRWPELDSVSGVVDGLELAAKLPATDGVPVLSCARGTAGRPQGRPEVVRDVLLGLAATHDLVVLDVQRQEQALAVALSLSDVVVVVLGHHVAQLAAASVVTERVKALGVEPWAVLRGPRDLEDVEELVRDHLDVSVLGRLGDDHRVAADLVDGVPPGVRGRGPVVEIADRVLLRLRSLGPTLPGSTAGSAATGAAAGALGASPMVAETGGAAAAEQVASGQAPVPDVGSAAQAGPGAWRSA